MTPKPAASPLRLSPKQAVLFDLDGTLLDTVGDIALALNRSLEEIGIEPLSTETVRGLIGKGARVLVARALTTAGRSGTDADIAMVFSGFLKHYDALYRGGESMATPYAGTSDTLQQLAASGFKLGVVTNKHRALAAEALQHTGLMGFFSVVVGGDTCAARKPAPAPILYACSVLDIPPANALMVGDSMNDVLAARAAGMPVICVPYGYNEGVAADSLPCDLLIETLTELPRLLSPAGARSAEV